MAQRSLRLSGHKFGVIFASPAILVIIWQPGYTLLRTVNLLIWHWMNPLQCSFAQMKGIVAGQLQYDVYMVPPQEKPHQ